MEPDVLQICYQRYQRELYLYLCELSGSPPLAEDLLQETFLKALLSLPDHHANIRAWLYMVARNLYFDQRKHEKHWDGLPVKEPTDGGDGPLEELLQNERHRTLYQALTQLEGRKREVLELQYFSGLSQREIGAILQMKPEYVRVLAHRARQDLRNWMEGHGYDLS